VFILGLIGTAALVTATATTGAGSILAGSDARTATACVAPAAALRDQVHGVATYYADDYHGRTMADGETFDMHDPAITASNRWPLGTRLRVRRAPGGPWEATLSAAERRTFYDSSVVVTVQDRGAFDHALDLSLAAFSALGHPDEGRINVTIEVLDSTAHGAPVQARAEPVAASVPPCSGAETRL
jgi:rare lipoprotein A